MQTTAPGKLRVKPSIISTAVSACEQEHHNTDIIKIVLLLLLFYFGIAAAATTTTTIRRLWLKRGYLRGWDRVSVGC